MSSDAFAIQAARRPALWLLVVLASGLCTAAAADTPVGVPPDPVEPDAASNMLDEPADAQRLPQAGVGADDLRFDLECATVERDVTETRGGPGQEPHARPYTVNSRHIVDLGASKYCDAEWCWVRGVWRIHGVDADSVSFLNVHEPGFVSVETFDRRSGRLIVRSRWNGVEFLGEGTCRQQPFSGFPDTSDSPFQDPW